MLYLGIWVIYQQFYIPMEFVGQCTMAQALKEFGIMDFVPLLPFSWIWIVSDRKYLRTIFCQFHFLSNIWEQVDFLNKKRYSATNLRCFSYILHFALPLTKRWKCSFILVWIKLHAWKNPFVLYENINELKSILRIWRADAPFLSICDVFSSSEG